MNKPYKHLQCKIVSLVSTGLEVYLPLFVIMCYLEGQIQSEKCSASQENVLQLTKSLKSDEKKRPTVLKTGLAQTEHLELLL